MNKQEFIEKSLKSHSIQYDYSKVEDKKLILREKVCIICPEHGEFWQTVESHVNGSNCPKCANRIRGQKKAYTTKSFIEQANRVHKEKYDYSKVEYINSSSKICIICPEHGEFWQTPHDHLQGAGCPKCKGKKISSIHVDSLEDFISKAKSVHGDFYDYSKVEYKNSRTKICIICPEHGEFWQTPNSHLNGTGCPECSRQNKFLTLEQFISKARSVHGNLYDYSKVEYKGWNIPVCIICPKHGEFWQTPNIHISGQCGCQVCHSSKGEKIIEQFLKDNGIKYKSQYNIVLPEIVRSSNKIRVDFMIEMNDKQIFIEYNGLQHYKFIPYFFKTQEDFEKQLRRDQLLRDFCELNKESITLVEIKYDKSKNEIEEILKDILSL